MLSVNLMGQIQNPEDFASICELNSDGKEELTLETYSFSSVTLGSIKIDGDEWFSYLILNYNKIEEVPLGVISFMASHGYENISVINGFIWVTKGDYALSKYDVIEKNGKQIISFTLGTVGYHNEIHDRKEYAYIVGHCDYVE